MKRIATDILDDLLKIKSYKSDGKRQCAKMILDILTSIGFYGEVVYGFGSPIVFAEFDSGVDNNILFYSHYDVKPEGDLQAWYTDPFKPTYDVKTNKVFARGAGDDKGQIFAVISGIKEALLTSDELIYNITLLIEGDEECGSVGLYNFCVERFEGKKFDAIIINDSHWLGDNPVIYTGVRGQQSINIYYDRLGMDEDQHAGNYGGKEVGAAREFISILLNVLEQIDELIRGIPTTENEYGNAVSLTHISSGDNVRSTIPKKAFAKIDVRFVQSFIPQKVCCILEKAKQEYGIIYEIIQQKRAFVNQENEVFIEQLRDVIKIVTGLEPKIRKYSGAYLPIESLRTVNGIKYVIPFAQSDEHNHAPNENISLTHIGYGIEIVKHILKGR